MHVPFHDDGAACRAPRAKEHIANDQLATVAGMADTDDRPRMVLVPETLPSAENDGLCLAPYRSYAENIGFDGSGTHCGDANGYAQSALNPDMIPPLPDLIMEDRDALEQLRAHYMRRPGKLEKLGRKWRRLMRRLG